MPVSLDRVRARAMQDLRVRHCIYRSGSGLMVYCQNRRFQVVFNPRVVWRGKNEEEGTITSNEHLDNVGECRHEWVCVTSCVVWV